MNASAAVLLSVYHSLCTQGSQRSLCVLEHNGIISLFLVIIYSYQVLVYTWSTAVVPVLRALLCCIICTRYISMILVPHLYLLYRSTAKVRSSVKACQGMRGKSCRRRFLGGQGSRHGYPTLLTLRPLNAPGIYASISLRQNA